MLYFIVGKCAEMPSYVLNLAFSVVARITKLGWFDAGQQDVFQQTEQIISLSQGGGGVAYKIVGITLFSFIVQELSEFKRFPTMTMALHSRITISFKESKLLDIFKTALRLAESELCGSTVPPSNDGSGSGDVALRTATLKLVNTILSYNFLSYASACESDDINIAQIPRSWRSVIEDPGFVQLFFRLYSAAPVPPTSARVLENVSLIATIRVSLFDTDEEKVAFLVRVMEGIGAVIAGRVGLAYPENHLMTCLVLSRLKANASIARLTAAPCWGEWIKCVYAFTHETFLSTAFVESPNSVHYLMHFWSRLALSLKYLTGNDGARTAAATYAAQVLELFVTNQLRAVTPGEHAESPDEEAESLEYVQSIARCNYPAAGSFVLRLLDALIATFFRPLEQAWTASPAAIAVAGVDTGLVLAQSAYVVGVAARCIESKMSARDHVEDEIMDGDIAARVLYIMGVHGRRLEHLCAAVSSSSSSTVVAAAASATLSEEDCGEAQLELALLRYWGCFHSTFIHGENRGRVYEKLIEAYGIGSAQELLGGVLLKKVIGTNLAVFGQNEKVVTESLRLFDAIMDSSSQLVDQDTLGTLIQKHNAQDFGPGKWEFYYLFYRALGRLVFTEDKFYDTFEKFMAPITASVRGFVRTRGPEAAGLKIIHQLRGLFESAFRDMYYVSLYNWFYPMFTPFSRTFFECYGANNNANMCAFMRLIEQMVTNNSCGRIHFDRASAHEVLIFKEVCYPAMVSFAQLTLALREKAGAAITEAEERAICKNIKIFLRVLLSVLKGNYLNFSIFEIYNDRCFNEIVMYALRLVFTSFLSADKLFAYEKLCNLFFEFVAQLTETFPQSFVSLLLSGPESFELFGKFVQYFMESFKFENNRLLIVFSTKIIDNLFSLYTYAKTDTDANELQFFGSYSFFDYPTLVKSFDRMIYEAYPDLLPSILFSLFYMAIFGDSDLVYSVSKALVTLTIASPQSFTKAKMAILSTQPEQFRNKLLATFTTLEDSLTPEAADVSVAILSTFVRETKPYISPAPFLLQFK